LNAVESKQEGKLLLNKKPCSEIPAVKTVSGHYGLQQDHEGCPRQRARHVFLEEKLFQENKDDQLLSSAELDRPSARQLDHQICLLRNPLLPVQVAAAKVSFHEEKS
jgi:hypothetical protein